MSDARKYPILCSLPMLQLLQMCDVHLHLLIPLHHLLPPALADSWPVLAMLRSGFIKMLLLRIISYRSFLSLQRSPAGAGSKPRPPLGCIRWPNPLSTSIQPNCYKHLVHKWLIDLFPNAKLAKNYDENLFSVGDVGDDWLDTGLYSPLLTPLTVITPLANNNGFTGKTDGTIRDTSNATENADNFRFGHLVALTRCKALPSRRWSI